MHSSSMVIRHPGRVTIGEAGSRLFFLAHHFVVARLLTRVLLVRAISSAVGRAAVGIVAAAAALLRAAPAVGIGKAVNGSVVVQH